MKGKATNNWLVIDTKSFRLHFGQNLKRFRKENNLSQEEFAALCKISRAYYGRIERGEYSPTIDLCYQIALALQINVYELFYDLTD